MRTGTLRPTFFVLVDVAAKSLLRDNLQVIRGAHGIGQPETAITLNTQVSFQLILGQVLKTARPRGRHPLVEHVTEKSLQEAHR